MAKKLLMGNEAIGLGAIRAGVSVVTGYPGTPSTEVLETIAKYNDGSIHVEWSTNEKSALEVAAGASYTGARVMVTMKQVGLNVASDPLMSLNYIGIKGGMVIVVADDPGPISSQTEQDTRHFGKYAKLAVFDPSNAEEAYLMIEKAFEYSEKYHRPVIFRPTTRVCHSCAPVELLEKINVPKPEGFIKDSKWVIFPRLTYLNHIKLEEDLKQMSVEFCDYERNFTLGKGKKGIASGGGSYAYVKEALKDIDESEYNLLKISTYPVPEKTCVDFLNSVDEVLVVEELDPVIEKELIYLCGLHNIKVTLKGKLTGDVPNAGENSVDNIINIVYKYLGKKLPEKESLELPQLPVRPPVLCAGCPHRASFFAVKEATKGMKAVYSGDIGCYTLGNAKPLDMVDTCLCMGAGITVAQGIHIVEPDTLNFAFVGDSTFFHTGLQGIINAVYNETDIIVVILDNLTTAMTGSQPHPGTGKTMMNGISQKISIEAMVKAMNVDKVVKANPFNADEAQDAVKGVINEKGVRVIIYQAPCIVVQKGKEKCTISNDKCTGCKMCINKLGCPAISFNNKKAQINPTLCTGCGICKSVCKFNAIQ